MNFLNIFLYIRVDRYQIRIKFLFCEKEMYLAIKICICYNAIRQKVMMSPFGRKDESPDRNGVQSRDSSFLFVVAKHPPGYLLSLSCLSSHLLMRWQTTPAATVTRKVMMISIWTPPPVVGCRLNNIKIITYPLIFFYPFLKRH